MPNITTNFQQGLNYYSSQQYQRAKECFQAVLRENSTHNDALFCLALVEIELQENAEALGHLNSVLNHDPNYASAYIPRAELRYFTFKDLSAAELDINEALKHIATIAPLQQARLYHLQGLVLLDNEKYQEALPVFNQSLALQPNPAVLLTRGNLHQHLEQFDKAIQDYNLVLAEPSLDRWARARLLEQMGQTHFCLNQPEKAKEDYQNLLNLEPANKQAIIGLGISLNLQRKFSEAKQFFEKVPTEQRDASFLYDYSITLKGLGDLGQALQCMEAVIQLEPDDPDCYVVLADIQLARHEFTAAKKAAEKAIELSGQKSLYAFSLLEQICRALGDEEGKNRAKTALKALGKGTNEERIAQYNAKLRKGNIRSALKLAEMPNIPGYSSVTSYGNKKFFRSAALNRPDIDAIKKLLLGIEEDYRKTQDMSQAKRRSANALRKYPDNLSAVLLYTKYILLDNNSTSDELKHAEEALTKCVTINSQDAILLLWRAKVKERLENLGSALTDIDKAIELSPREGELYAIRANYYQLLGKEASLIREDQLQAMRYGVLQEELGDNSSLMPPQITAKSVQELEQLAKKRYEEGRQATEVSKYRCYLESAWYYNAIVTQLPQAFSFIMNQAHAYYAAANCIKLKKGISIQVLQKSNLLKRAVDSYTACILNNERLPEAYLYRGLCNKMRCETDKASLPEAILKDKKGSEILDQMLETAITDLMTGQPLLLARKPLSVNDQKCNEKYESTLKELMLECQRAIRQAAAIADTSRLARLTRLPKIDVNAVGPDTGKTALHRAVEQIPLPQTAENNYQDYVATIKLLIAHGANPLLKDKAGETALRIWAKRVLTEPIIAKIETLQTAELSSVTELLISAALRKREMAQPAAAYCYYGVKGELHTFASLPAAKEFASREQGDENVVSPTTTFQPG